MSKTLTTLWTSATVDALLGASSSKPWACRGVSINTQLLEEGDLFIALPGGVRDGHEFLEEAQKKGAVAAIISKPTETSLPTLMVPDTLKALEALAIAGRERCAALRLAVTGSVGKTTIKEMLRAVFSAQGKTHANVSSYNNFTGVPLTLTRMPQETQFGIFEVGMNHPGEMRPLSHLIAPNVAIINRVVECHIEHFASVAEIARAKAEIFEGMTKGGRVILNRDNDQYALLADLASQRGLTVYSFGEHENADFRLLSWKGNAEGSQGEALIAGKSLPLSFTTPGHHWALNSLAVLGAAHLAGLDLTKSTESLTPLKPHPGRGTQYKGWFTLIDESYNANPTSMRAALAVLGQSQGHRKIAVIGDMREIGEQARARHEELLFPLLESKIDLVFCCGPHMRHLYETLPETMKGAYAPTSLELIPYVLEAVEPHDCVSVKASLGTRMKPIVEALLTHQARRS